MNEREELLRRAERHIFATGPRDCGQSLCVANMKYGLAKIHYLQQQLGLPADATFIGAPDMTVTRNVNRWNSGFGYGGKLTWGNGAQELMILDVKPNCCGMLVGGLDHLPDYDLLIERLDRFKDDETRLDGVKINWDFDRSNHFIDVFQVRALADVPLPEYAFVIHCAGSELRGETLLGEGLYWDASPGLLARAELIATPFGDLRVLTGSEAVEYYRFYQLVEDFTLRRRALAAERLFGEYQLIANQTHQGLTSMNDAMLGTHQVVEDGKTLYPMTLRGDIPAYLLLGKSNFSEEILENYGFEKRAKALGVYDRLRQANILPHGGGYDFPHMTGVTRVVEFGEGRYFEV
ncbi:MAG: hypothetical protein ACETWR_11920, partial [Anaerolineae bacterium]